jgi:hypothetical protein
MNDLVTSVLGAVFSGGATGLLGVLIQRWFDFKHKQQEIEVVKLQLENAKELAQIEAGRSTRVAEMDMEARFVEADAAVMQASFKHDQASYLLPEAQQRKGFVGGLIVFMMASVDFLRGILRPGMTAYLCGLVTVMFFWVRNLAASYGMSLSADQAFQLMLQIILTILYVFSTCTTWWFGARPPKTKESS